jgi:hypothetical protein
VKPAEVDGWSDLLALGVDPSTEMFTPTVPQDRSSVGNYGSKYDDLLDDGDVGILGWHLNPHSCQS